MELTLTIDTPRQLVVKINEVHGIAGRGRSGSGGKACSRGAQA